MNEPVQWSRELQERIFRVIQYYADQTTYEGERIGDVLACCLAGAAMSVDGEFSNKERKRAPVTRLSEVMGFKDVDNLVQWNDDKKRTHAQILGWLDDAIARVEKRRA